jgi:pentatricopeptide repeat protein
VVAFSATINACEKCEKYTEALEVFRLMKKYNVRPNVVTFSSVLSACGKSGKHR